MVSMTHDARSDAARPGVSGLGGRVLAVLVLDFFAFIWAGTAVVSAALPPWVLAVPAALSAGLAVAAWRRGSHLPPRSPAEARRVRKITVLATLGEGLAILVAVNGLTAAGHLDDLAPAVALIVGLHFVPMGWLLPSPIYRATAAALIVGSLASFALPAGDRNVVVCCASAVILWGTAIVSGQQGKQFFFGKKGPKNFFS
jgi:hypothetical protein